jgi:hypothetical protein
VGLKGSRGTVLLLPHEILSPKKRNRRTVPLLPFVSLFTKICKNEIIKEILKGVSKFMEPTNC